MKELHSQQDRNKANTATEWPISGRVSGLHQNYYASTIGYNTFPQSLAVWFPPCQGIQRKILKIVFEVSSAVEMTLRRGGRCTDIEHLLFECAQSPSKQYRDLQTLAHTSHRFSLHLFLCKFAEDKQLTFCFPAWQNSPVSSSPPRPSFPRGGAY